MADCMYCIFGFMFTQHSAKLCLSEARLKVELVLTRTFFGGTGHVLGWSIFHDILDDMFLIEKSLVLCQQVSFEVVLFVLIEAFLVTNLAG